MKIITLSGTDGSGKSTQLELLRERLERSNQKIASFHALEFSIGNRFLRFLKREKGFRPGSEKANTYASCFTVFLRVCSLLVDLVAFRPYLLFLKRAGFDVIISDRYFIDTLVNIIYLSDQHRRHGFWDALNHFLLHLAELLIIRPDFAFFLDVSPESVMRRKNAPEQGVDYIERKRNQFSSLAGTLGLIMVDADTSKEQVALQISQYLRDIFSTLDGL